MKIVLFRADSSSTIGTGHIMRDLVLAQKYVKKGYEVVFATQELQGNINYKILESGYKLKKLNSNSKKELVKLIKKLDIDLLVIDHYKIDYKKEIYIKEKTKVKILSFDDTYKKHNCDILLNHNLGAEAKKYKKLVPKKCNLKCGSKYTLLRNEFYKEKNKQYKKNKKTKQVLVAMGGADNAKLNVKILKILEKFQNIRVVLVTTKANKNLKELQKYIQDKRWVRLEINATNIAQLMAQSNFAIITPTVTANEAYYMQLPFIAIKTAKNQKSIYKYLKQNNFLTLEQFDKKLLQQTLSFLIKYLEFQMINFIDLSLEEKKMILKWRNTKSVKRWMYNRKAIPLDKHLQYIDSLKNRKDRVYFLVKDKKDYLGVVDLTQIIKDKSAELGIYTNPSVYGVGRLLMSKIIYYAFNTLQLKKLKANVYIHNEKAISLYKKFHFKNTGILKDKYEIIQIMELKNENR